MIKRKAMLSCTFYLSIISSNKYISFSLLTFIPFFSCYKYFITPGVNFINAKSQFTSTNFIKHFWHLKHQKWHLSFMKQNPGVNFINAKRGHLKLKIMAFKCQNWRLTFIKFYKTLLAFKRKNVAF